jgi:hypothetical protein
MSLASATAWEFMRWVISAGGTMPGRPPLHALCRFILAGAADQTQDLAILRP